MTESIQDGAHRRSRILTEVPQGRELMNHRVLDVFGHSIGHVSGVYADAVTHAAEWLAVRTGIFGTHEALVPVSLVTPHPDGGLQVPLDRNQVNTSPHHDPAVTLTVAMESALLAHYDIPDTHGEPTAQGDEGSRNASVPARRLRL